MPPPLSVPSTPTLRTSLGPIPPFRLDLTVTALRRLPQNLVDVLEGPRYLRAFQTENGPVVWVLEQRRDRIDLALHGDVGDAAPYRALAERMLGTAVDLAPFYATAQGLPGLGPLADRFKGLKPPRYSSLWEAILNAIPFQQLSLTSALSTLGRLIQASSRPVEFGGRLLYPLPSPETCGKMSEDDFALLGFSHAKARALREAALVISSGDLQEGDLDSLGTEALASRLEDLRGVGPWTAALMMLRGFRRLEIFPAGDAGASRGLKKTLPDVEPDELLQTLGPYRGMLYYHLLLAR